MDKDITREFTDNSFILNFLLKPMVDMLPKLAIYLFFATIEYFDITYVTTVHMFPLLLIFLLFYTS